MAVLSALLQYSPVCIKQVSLVSSLLYGTQTKLVCFEFAGFNEQKSVTQNMAISVETVPIAKYEPSKNQSEHSDLPQVYLAK